MAKQEFTCASFIINSKTELLVLHPTGARKNLWSVPKGRSEGNEVFINAAERELQEETGLSRFDLNAALLFPMMELESQRYVRRRKTLVPFLYQVNNSLNEYKFHCDIKSDDNGHPEADEFAWISFERAYEVLHYTQVKTLEEIEIILERMYFEL